MPKLPNYAIETELAGLRSTLLYEIGDIKFAYISKDQAKFFEQDALWGDAVNNAFPEAALDIKEAGNCIAADLNTAAVCLFMRVAEVGLRRLAVLVDADIKHDFDFADWHELIGGIKKKLPPHGTFRDKNREEVERFYHAISADAEWLKTIRHEAMHARKPYGKAEADGIRARVEDFMKKLADDPPQLVSSLGH